jgi:CheY-like chemotaxis protein
MTEKFEQGRRVVLLAEDDLEMRLLLSLALQKDGWSVIECKDGMNLLAQLGPLLNGQNEVECDLIITDIRMPGVTGMEVVEGLAGLPGCPPVILITAFGDAETHERARQLGVAAVLDKPFEIEEFIRVVHDVLMAPYTARREKSRS